ncbi:MAG: GNAT family protein [Acidimicrobiales bacterium]
MGDALGDLGPAELAARFGLDVGTALDELGPARPMLRSLLLVGLLRQRQIPVELADSLVTVGELAEWSELGGQDAPDSAAASTGWPIETPRALLRAVAPVDLPAIHLAFNDAATSWRLPSRGRTVLPSAVERALEGADLQLIGAPRDDPAAAVSLLALNRHDPTNQTADLTVIGLGRTALERGNPRPHRGVRLETVAMFISHAFRALNLHKITASVPAYNWHYFGDGAGLVFVEEGVQREQLLVDGRRHDVHLIGILRSQWTELEDHLGSAFGHFV